MSKKLEIACFNLASAKVAALAGADRIELCEDYQSGGITPSIADFKALRDLTNLPIYIMIRPRAGNFCYYKKEINAMAKSITDFYQVGADGFVFGCLTQELEVDLETIELLIKAAKDKPCTFHRAFDEIKDWPTALEQIIACGFSTILTSGRARTAVAGLNTLKAIIEAAKNSIAIMPGGGLRADNLAAFSESFKAEYYHSAALGKDNNVVSEDELLKMKHVLTKN